MIYLKKIIKKIKNNLIIIFAFKMLFKEEKSEDNKVINLIKNILCSLILKYK